MRTEDGRGRATEVGPWGRATHLDIDPGLQGAESTVTSWLLTGRWHPLWPQFLISVVDLVERPGRPPAHLQYPGATHELLVFALHPGPNAAPIMHAAETLEQGGLRAVGGWLEPVDVAHQTTATDAEMSQIAQLAARACVWGELTPSTDDARERLRENWLQAIVKTLAHMRGEEHAP